MPTNYYVVRATYRNVTIGFPYTFKFDKFDFDGFNENVTHHTITQLKEYINSEVNMPELNIVPTLVHMEK